MSTSSESPAPIIRETVRQPRQHGFLGFLRPSWTSHPGVRSHEELTRGERAADHMRAAMGSWAFVFSALGFLAIWMIGNRNSGFDKYPFILLNLVLSCVAALQGAILLIAAKRSDQIASELAKHDFDTDTAAAARIEQVHDRLETLEIEAKQTSEENQQLLRQVLAELAELRTALGR
jgi:uncharacterized membrane protein